MCISFRLPESVAFTAKRKIWLSKEDYSWMFSATATWAFWLLFCTRGWSTFASSTSPSNNWWHSFRGYLLIASQPVHWTDSIVCTVLKEYLHVNPGIQAKKQVLQTTLFTEGSTRVTLFSRTPWFLLNVSYCWDMKWYIYVCDRKAVRARVRENMAVSATLELHGRLPIIRTFKLFHHLTGKGLWFRTIIIWYLV